MTLEANVHRRDFPVLFSYGFRPFFLGAAVWAALAMCIWLAMLSGQVDLPVIFDPVSWHAHAFVFGYLSAVIAGFLLTALPNWTGRPPLSGWPLVALFGLWLAGRAASLVSGWFAPAVFAVLDNAMAVTLVAIVLREIIASKNWKNLIVLAMLVALICGNLMFHAAAHGFSAGSMGLRLEVAAGVLLVAVIGGRVVPSFTRNWLKQQGSAALPAQMGRFDQVSLLLLLVSLIAWLLWPDAALVTTALLVTGVLHCVRLMRWKGWLTFREPLVLILHIGYFCIPLGAILIGLSGFTNNTATYAGVQHIWMAGAIGIMTLAIMTRATLGHTGHALHAGAGTVAVYMAIAAAVLLRLMAGSLVDWAQGALMLSGLLWIGAFVGFVVLYGPLLIREKRA